MTDQQLNAETRYFGITSGTGHLWYNFDPFSNLECGTASVMDNFENDDREMDVDWQTLGELLEAGRRYE